MDPENRGSGFLNTVIFSARFFTISSGAAGQFPQTRCRDRKRGSPLPPEGRGADFKPFPVACAAFRHRLDDQVRGDAARSHIGPYIEFGYFPKPTSRIECDTGVQGHEPNWLLIHTCEKNGNILARKNDVCCRENGVARGRLPSLYLVQQVVDEPGDYRSIRGVCITDRHGWQGSLPGGNWVYITRHVCSTPYATRSGRSCGHRMHHQSGQTGHASFRTFIHQLST